MSSADDLAFVPPWNEPSEQTSHALFAGDEGGLDPAARRALVVLLKNPFISRQSHPQEFKSLVKFAAPIRSRLNDMFLNLTLDTEREVAFKSQAQPETSERFPTLLHATEWTREETVLLVYLRAQAHAAAASGDPRTYVERDDLMEHLAGMRPPTATNQSRDAGHTQRAIESLVSAGVLVGRKDADRWEVARAIELLLPLETLQTLLAWVRSSAVDGDTPATPILPGAPPSIGEVPAPPVPTVTYDESDTLL